MKKLLLLIFVLSIAHAYSQDWIAYKSTRINIKDYKATDTIYVRIDTVKIKAIKITGKIFYFKEHGKPDDINTDEVISYCMNNIIHVMKKYTVVYKDRYSVLTDEETPLSSNMAFIIDNSTGKLTENIAANDTKANTTKDTVKELQNRNLNTDIDILTSRLNKLELSEKEINLHLEKHHTEFIYGVIGCAAGIGITVAGAMLIANGRYVGGRNNYYSNNTNTTNNAYGQRHSSASSGIGDIVTGVGVAMSVVGIAIMIDSDKWFSKRFNHNW
jgi:hypothetical protein